MPPKSTTTQVDAPPRASILVESMRDIGYSLETALADVIDNSITAGAKTIKVRVDSISSEMRIAIVDDGRGMDKAELLESMRLGSRSPRENRPARDLGRFGLGLKTASFSQCRRLTVVARKDGTASAATWDLDYVAQQDRWALLIRADVDAIPFIEHLGADGALVVWENLDRAVEQEATESGRRHFVKRVDDARQHLELVFHRYLTGEPGLQRVKILVNDVPLRPFDPFNSAHPATMRGQTEQVRVGTAVVEITPFTLPHHRNITAPDWDKYAGRNGYLKDQGFYLYREKRLIVHGTWFGLARQTELTKLARVRIDMPNDLDAEWQVDVKKAWARPPLQVRERLQRIITELGAPSRTIYIKRGARLHDSKVSMWQRVQDNNEINYRLNLENPILTSFVAQLGPGVSDDFRRLMQAIGAGLPVDAIYADLAGSPENVRAERIDTQSLRRLVDVTWNSLVDAGRSGDVILDILRVVEPFRSHWDDVESMIDDKTKHGDR